MTRPVSVALVGGGYWGRKLLPKFLAASDCPVRWVCDIHADHLAEMHKVFPQVPTTLSYDDLLRDPSTDAILLVTPPSTHFTLAEKALEAGKHVWIEKPLALHLEEGKLLVRLARSRELVLFVDHTFLYDPAIEMIRQLIQSGGLGTVYHIFSQRLNLGRIKRDSNVWWNSAPHDVSIILYLLTAEPVSIALQGYRYLQSDIEDLNVAALEMANGASAFIYHNWLYPENTAKLTLVGSKGLLTYEGKFGRQEARLYEYSVEQSDGKVPARGLPTTIPSKITAERQLDIGAEEPLMAAVNDFLGSIRDRRAPRSDGDFSLKVLAVLEAGERSLRLGGTKTAIV